MLSRAFGRIVHGDIGASFNAGDQAGFQDDLIDQVLGKRVLQEQMVPDFVKIAENVQDEKVREWYKVTDTNPVRDKIYVKGRKALYEQEGSRTPDKMINHNPRSHGDVHRVLRSLLRDL